MAEFVETINESEESQSGWRRSVQSVLIIRTGEGSSFTPLWKNSCAKEIEYNIAQFDFPKIDGSQIYRGTPMARKFSLEIYFQGENHLEDALKFEIAAKDPRAWTIFHPIYGSILVQPSSLKFDYSGFNITQITGTIFETLGSQGLQTTIVPEDKILADKEALDILLSEYFGDQNDLFRSRELNPANINSRDLSFSQKQVTTLKGINQSLYNIGVKSMKVTEDAGTYLNQFNVANATIEQGITHASEIMTNLQAVINFPSQIINTIKVRVNVLQNQFNTLRANVVGVVVRQSDKVNYETTGSTLVSSMCVNAITNIDYKTRDDVLNQIDNIKNMHDTFSTDLDNLQTDNAGNVDSYIPNSDVISQLSDLINFTIQNLYQIALSAKQERIIILEADSNVIILTHRFYPLLEDDSTIQQFMDNNNIFLNEILQIRKGRQLSFYI